MNDWPLTTNTIQSHVDSICKKNPDLAKKWLHAMFFDPECMQFYAMRGDIMDSLGEFSIAEVAYKAALTANPMQPIDGNEVKTLEKVKQHIKARLANIKSRNIPM